MKTPLMLASMVLCSPCQQLRMFVIYQFKVINQGCEACVRSQIHIQQRLVLIILSSDCDGQSFQLRTRLQLFMYLLVSNHAFCRLEQPFQNCYLFVVDCWMVCMMLNLIASGCLMRLRLAVTTMYTLCIQLYLSFKLFIWGQSGSFASNPCFYRLHSQYRKVFDQ